MRSLLSRWQDGRVPARFCLRYHGARQPLTVTRRKYAAVASLEELVAAGRNGEPAGMIIHPNGSCVNMLTRALQYESGHGTMK